MEPELEALYEKHNRWLEDLEKERKSPSSALAAYVDPSGSNLSSIVALAKAGESGCC
jgi:pyridoxine/pyridoxamine 5'-phosphate oxidase